MKKIMTVKLFLPVVLSTFLIGCATTSGVKESSTDVDVAVITDILIQDNILAIKSNKTFTYTMYSANDPYRTTIEIPDIKAGNFKSKIVSDKAGITEIIPQEIEAPKPAVKLDIVLQAPSSVVPVYKDNTLTLMIKAEEPVARAPEPAAKVEEPVVVSDIKPRTDTEQTSSKPAAKESSYDTKKPENSVSPLSRATEIRNVEIKKSADAVTVVITGNGSMMPNVFPIDDRIVVDIPGVSMNADMPKSVISPVKGIRAGKHKDKVRIVIDLKEKTNYDVTAIGSSIEISLAKKDIPVAQASVNSKEMKTTDAPVSMVSPPSSLQTTFESAKSNVDKCQRYLEGKENVSLDFQDQDIIPILRLLADISGCNLVIHPEVKGKYTMNLREVQWNFALDTLLRTFSLSKIVNGNIIRIVPTNFVAKELDELAKAKKAESEAGDLKTKIFPVNYADLAKLKDAIDKAKVLSSRGTITLDERGSSVIVNDIDANLERIGALISEIDQENMQARQVMIEARIVEINTDYTKDLGIQWGVGFTKPRAGDTITVGGLSTSGGTGFSGNNFLVNLPAAAGGGAGGAIGFGYISKAANFSLDLQLSAMEQVKKGKVISSPKIMTMNNESAKISQGRNLQIPIATADKTDLKEVPILLTLDVKPRIAPGGAILMNLKITKDEFLSLIAAGTSTGVDMTKNTIDTTVLVNNGDTVVIGGIFKQSTTKTDDAVPGLSKIPLLGLLFKKEKNIESSNEIIVFITPKIVEFDSLK